MATNVAAGSGPRTSTSGRDHRLTSRVAAAWAGRCGPPCGRNEGADPTEERRVPDPQDLYRLADDVPDLGRPVMIQALTGFVDAGAAARLAREHLLTSLPG